MEDKQLKILVHKFLKGKCTAAENEVLSEWWQDMLRTGRASQFLSLEEQEALQSAMWNAIQQGLHRKEQPASAPIYSKGKWRNVALLSAAASIVLVVLFYVANPFSNQRVVSTAFGETMEVELPDGSIVILNGNSSVHYDRDWDPETDRNIWINGEGYFKVVHTKSHTRFIVHTPNDLQITVLETKFNVNNRKDLTEVLLVEGKVELQGGSNTYVMHPKEMVMYSPSAPKFLFSEKQTDQSVSWTSNVLIFEDEKLSVIADKLNDRYGVKIKFENRMIAQERFTGSIPTDSVLIFLDKIEKLYGMEVLREDDTYVIR